MKIKVSEATPLQLDWMVAKCEGIRVALKNGVVHDKELLEFQVDNGTEYQPSTNWAQGGPIIDANITKIEDYGDCWGAEGAGAPEQLGPTILIAAMRCYVASKLGDEVEVPDELA